MDPYDDGLFMSSGQQSIHKLSRSWAKLRGVFHIAFISFVAYLSVVRLILISCSRTFPFSLERYHGHTLQLESTRI